MEALTPWHLVLILLAAVLLFGYKKLPDASRSLGRSVRIFKGELHAPPGDAGVTGAPAAPATSAPSAGAELQAAPSATPAMPVPVLPSPEVLDAEAVVEEARAARLRERAAQLNTRGRRS